MENSPNYHENEKTVRPSGGRQLFHIFNKTPADHSEKRNGKNPQ